MNDLSSINSTGGVHMADANNYAAGNASSPEVLGKASKTSGVSWLVILELMQ